MTRSRPGSRGWHPYEPASSLAWARGDVGSGSTYYLLADEAGPLAQFVPSGFVAALERPESTFTPAWVPMRFMGQAALTLASGEGEARSEENAVFVAFGEAAWQALAGRDVPLLADGPLQLEFPRMPDRLP